MVEGNVVVKNKVGLHARPAGMVVTESRKFKSCMTIKKGNRAGNMKSLLGVLSIAAIYGDKLTIQADGEDEAAAVEALIGLIETIEE
jgi:phosphocarrier protein